MVGKFMLIFNILRTDMLIQTKISISQSVLHGDLN
jgi:hypothetical protein